MDLKGDSYKLDHYKQYPMNDFKLEGLVQNGPKNNPHWSCSEPLTVEQLLERFRYWDNAGSWREANGYPNAIKIRIAGMTDELHRLGQEG